MIQKDAACDETDLPNTGIIVVNLLERIDLKRWSGHQRLGCGNALRGRVVSIALQALVLVALPATGAEVQPISAPMTSAPSQTVAPLKTEAAQTTIDTLKVDIDRIVAGLQQQELTDKTLATFRSAADAIKAKADAVVIGQNPDLDAANARLKQLGPAPQATANEPAPIEADAVKQERDAQAKAVAQIEGIIKQAKLIGLEADEAVKTIGDRRRARFAETLTERTRSVLDPNLWAEAIAAVPSVLAAFQFLVSDWVGLVASHGGEAAIAFLSVLMAILLIILLPLRRRLFRLVSRDEALENPAYLRKVTAAAGIATIQVGAPVLGLLSLFLALQALDLSRDRTDQALLIFIEAIALGNAVYGLAIAILAPGKPQWRLVEISEPAAIVLRRLFAGLAIATGLGLFITRMLDLISTSIGLVFASSGLFAMVDAVFFVLVMHTISRAFVEHHIHKMSSASEPAQVSIVWRWLLPLAWLAAVICLGAAILGYIALARFLGQELIWFGVVLAALFIGLQLIDEVTTASFSADHAFATMMSRELALSTSTVQQFGVVLSGLGRLLALFVAFYFVRPPWADNSTDVLASMGAAFFGFKIGSFTFSPAALLLGLLSFGIGVGITRGVQRWLDNRFLPYTRLDLGLKNSISTGFGYLGYVLAAVVAFSAVGIGLENVALVAGALSVGIGFGLQSIVNNFVSGLILLAERPIKSGDLVEIGAEKGYVRKINVRSTEIETFDRASLIVPNSTLISGLVKNWMHRDPSGRCLITIGVSYESDVEQVREILLSAAKAHRLVQTFPGPSVLLSEFGPKAIDFQLVCMVANVNDVWNVQSDLRLTILKRLKKDGIDIPAAQRDVRIREIEGLSELIAQQLKLRETLAAEARDGGEAPEPGVPEPSV
jgi:small-conductance mechanosensitive channel